MMGLDLFKAALSNHLFKVFFEDIDRSHRNEVGFRPSIPKAQPLLEALCLSLFYQLRSQICKNFNRYLFEGTMKKVRELGKIPKVFALNRQKMSFSF